MFLTWPRKGIILVFCVNFNSLDEIKTKLKLISEKEVKSLHE